MPREHWFHVMSVKALQGRQGVGQVPGTAVMTGTVRADCLQPVKKIPHDENSPHDDCTYRGIHLFPLALLPHL
jgi:hypothetical protein